MDYLGTREPIKVNLLKIKEIGSLKIESKIIKKGNCFLSLNAFKDKYSMNV